MTSFTWIGLAFLVVVPLLLGLAIAVVPLQLGGGGIAYPRAAALSLLGLAVLRRGDGRRLPGQRRPGRRRRRGRRPVPHLAHPRPGRRSPIGAACVAGHRHHAAARPAWALLETPPFSFASLVSAGALLLTLPVLAGTLLLLFVDHHYGRIVFGGNQGIAGEIGWAVPAAADLRVRHPGPGLHGRAVPGGRWPPPADAVDGHRRHRPRRCRRGRRRAAGHADARPRRRDADPGHRPARRSTASPPCCRCCRS